MVDTMTPASPRFASAKPGLWVRRPFRPLQRLGAAAYKAMGGSVRSTTSQTVPAANCSCTFITPRRDSFANTANGDARFPSSPLPNEGLTEVVIEHV